MFTLFPIHPVPSPPRYVHNLRQPPAANRPMPSPPSLCDQPGFMPSSPHSTAPPALFYCAPKSPRPISNQPCKERGTRLPPLPTRWHHSPLNHTARNEEAKKYRQIPTHAITGSASANSSTTGCNDEPVLVEKRGEIVNLRYGSWPKMRQKLSAETYQLRRSPHPLAGSIP